MLTSYPERGPNLDIDFSFPLRGPLAGLNCLKVTNIAREGSYVRIEELHRGASSKLPAAGSGRRGQLGAIHTENLSKRKKSK